jgi:hypothetical protein
MLQSVDMRVYMAAVYTNGYKPDQARWDKLTPHEQDIVRNVPNILESYHYVGKQRFVDDMRRDGAKVFLDSGAFSAYTLGVTIPIPEYVEYIQRNRDIIRVEDGVLMAAVKDGIGDALETYRNQLEMEDRGVRPMPCFHAGEDERYLEYYVANYEYISLGGMVGSSTSQLMVWLDRMWDRYLVDGAGHAKIKVHGFGITAIPLMERYPWYSCDSSSWIQSAAFGTIVHPKHGPLSVSEKSPSRHDKGQHVTTLTPVEQDYIFRELERTGFTYERLSTVYESRAAYNLWAFGVINTLINAAHSEKFKVRVQELF